MPNLTYQDYPFIPNKYHKWYSAIIKRAKAREGVADYTEEHHVLPLSLGGDDTDDNRVILLAREHYLSHACLVKCTAGSAKQSMAYAFHYMHDGAGTQGLERRKCVNSRLYAVNKRIMAAAVSERMKLQMIGNTYRTGVFIPHNETTKKRISDALIGVRWDDARKANHSIALMGVPKPTRTAEHNQHQSEVQRGIKKPGISESNKRRVGMKYKPRTKTATPQV